MYWLAIVCSMHIGCLELQTLTQEDCIAAIPEGVRMTLMLEREFLYDDPDPYTTLSQMSDEELQAAIGDLNYQCVQYGENFGKSVSFPNL